MAPPLSSVEFIGFHATRSPETIALLINNQKITYKTFYREIGQTVFALKELDVAKGQSVAIDASNFYFHWLVVLACDVLGAATLSYTADETMMIKSTLARMDWVLHAPTHPPQAARRSHAMTPQWIKSILTTPVQTSITPACLDPKAPFRIVKSSGTTGQVKTMIHTREIHEIRLMRSQYYFGFNTNTRYLFTMPFAIQASHLDATLCVRVGGTCIFDNQKSILASIKEYAISDILFLPKTLIQVLNNIPDSHEKPSNIRARILGGELSKEIRDKTHKLLTTEILESYGTNETGTISRVNTDGVGVIIPGVRVEIVDEMDRQIFGKPGRVRLQSPSCVDGYLYDPQTSQKKFHGNWFYPGDVGIMTDPYTLEIVGRDDDLLNIQGIKYAPQPLEEKIAKELSIQDTCVTILDDLNGIAKVRIVIVADEESDIPNLREKLIPLLPPFFGNVELVFLKSIPRTATGKIQRNKLNHLLLSLQASQGKIQ
jgi:acyl-coenzyme A synthetase/AMP-(fatty) acid ligase